MKHFHTYATEEDFEENVNYVKPWVSLTKEGNIIRYNKHDPDFNGQSYVDLGLPSGTLWATKNVGASNTSDYGTYVAWGETASKSTYSTSNYAFGSSSSDCTKYNTSDGLIILEPSDDIAHIVMGGDWHIPTKAQFQELIANSNASANSSYAVFTSKINGNTLQIPWNKYKYDSTTATGYNARLWTSSLHESYYTGFYCNLERSGTNSYFSNIGVAATSQWANGRTYGYCIRAVIEPQW